MKLKPNNLALALSLFAVSFTSTNVLANNEDVTTSSPTTVASAPVVEELNAEDTDSDNPNKEESVANQESAKTDKSLVEKVKSVQLTANQVDLLTQYFGVSSVYAQSLAKLLAYEFNLEISSEASLTQEYLNNLLKSKNSSKEAILEEFSALQKEVSEKIESELANDPMVKALSSAGKGSYGFVNQSSEWLAKETTSVATAIVKAEEEEKQKAEESKSDASENQNEQADDPTTQEEGKQNPSNEENETKESDSQKDGQESGVNNSDSETQKEGKSETVPNKSSGDGTSSQPVITEAEKPKAVELKKEEEEEEVVVPNNTDPQGTGTDNNSGNTVTDGAGNGNTGDTDSAGDTGDTRDTGDTGGAITNGAGGASKEGEQEGDNTQLTVPESQTVAGKESEENNTQQDSALQQTGNAQQEDETKQPKETQPKETQPEETLPEGELPGAEQDPNNQVTAQDQEDLQHQEVSGSDETASSNPRSAEESESKEASVTVRGEESEKGDEEKKDTDAATAKTKEEALEALKEEIAKTQLTYLKDSQKSTKVLDTLYSLQSSYLDTLESLASIENSQRLLEKTKDLTKSGLFVDVGTNSVTADNVSLTTPFLTLGGNYQVTDYLTVGGYATVAKLNNSFELGTQRKGKSATFGVFASSKFDDFHVALSYAKTFNKYDESLKLSIAPTSLKGYEIADIKGQKPKLDTLSALVSYDYKVNDKLTLTPKLALSYTKYDSKNTAFQLVSTEATANTEETASAKELAKIQYGSTKVFDANLGLDATYQATKQLSFTGGVRVGYLRQKGANSTAFGTQYDFNTLGVAVERLNSLEYGAKFSANYRINSQHSFNLDLNYTRVDKLKVSSSSAKLGYTYTF